MLLRTLAVVGLGLLGGIGETRACDAGAYKAIVAEANAQIAALNARHSGSARAALAALKAREGWSEADMPLQALPYISDETTERLDDDSRAALAAIAAYQVGNGAACPPLESVRSHMTRIVGNTQAKWEHLGRKLQAALQPAMQAPLRAATAPD